MNFSSYNNIIKLYLYYESMFCYFKCCKNEQLNTLHDFYVKGKKNLDSDFDLKLIIENQKKLKF